jgi:hypothetical protein
LDLNNDWPAPNYYGLVKPFGLQRREERDRIALHDNGYQTASGR